MSFADVRIRTDTNISFGSPLFVLFICTSLFKDLKAFIIMLFPVNDPYLLDIAGYFIRAYVINLVTGLRLQEDRP